VRASLDTLRARGVRVVEPGSGYLACGWLGKGRLAEPAEIVEAALSVLRRRGDLAGETVLVTAGPTLEDLDPVRFLSNRSSGRMGYRIAEAARDRGARVILVSGPTDLPAPAGVELLKVRSAEQMADAVLARRGETSVVVMAAAVADYRPAAAAPQKVKKRDGGLTLELVRTRDILKNLGETKGSLTLVGFAAETENVRENALRKLREKRLDLIVANDVSVEGAGFGSETNAATLFDAGGGETAVPLVDKRVLADAIWDRLVELKRVRADPSPGTTPVRA
jgi:phosphopantothenoylcysteine decarboxylase/phosphopantothenate--cysteine ligase